MKLQSKLNEAYSAFFKSAWNTAWKDTAYLSITQIDCSCGEWQAALEHVKESLIRNWHNHKACQLKASLLRKKGNSGATLKRPACMERRWEGGEGKITFQYAYCRLRLAKRAIDSQDFTLALQYLKETDEYPHNLGEGKLSTVNENDVNYFKGVCYRGMNDEANAVKWFTKAARGPEEPKQAFYYNDENPDKIYYQDLAWRALGFEEKAQERFYKLIAHGKKHLDDECKIDYFAVSLPDLAIWEEDLNKRNKIHCYNVMALDYMGIGNLELAEKFMGNVKRLDVNHQRILNNVSST